jgi:hypothetical protein
VVRTTRTVVARGTRHGATALKYPVVAGPEPGPTAYAYPCREVSVIVRRAAAPGGIVGERRPASVNSCALFVRLRMRNTTAPIGANAGENCTERPVMTTSTNVTLRGVEYAGVATRTLASPTTRAADVTQYILARIAAHDSPDGETAVAELVPAAPEAAPVVGGESGLDRRSWR